MRIYNGEEYYTVTEVSQLIRENTGIIYYHIRNNKNFPKPTVIKDVMHFNEKDIANIEKILAKSVNRGGRKKEKNYIPKQNNSYSRLRVQYAELLEENKRLKEELKKERERWK